MSKVISLSVLVWALILFTSMGFSQTSSTDDQNENPSSDTAEELPVKNDFEAIWKTDSKTIYDMIVDVRAIKPDSNDSTLQAQKKKKQFVLLHEQMNKKLKGKVLSLKAVRVKDVEPQKDLTPYGIKKAKELIAQMKKDPTSAILIGNGDPFDNPLVAMALAFSLASDPQCYKETGRYEISYSIPVPGEDGQYSDYKEGIYNANGEPITVTIIRIEKSEDKASAVNKKSVIALSSKIVNIIYTNNGYSEKIEIAVE